MTPLEAQNSVKRVSAVPQGRAVAGPATCLPAGSEPNPGSLLEFGHAHPLGPCLEALRRPE